MWNARTQDTTLISQLICVNIDLCVEILIWFLLPAKKKKNSSPSGETQLVQSQKRLNNAFLPKGKMVAKTFFILFGVIWAGIDVVAFIKEKVPPNKA